MMKIDEENGRLTRSCHSTLKTMAMGHLVTTYKPHGRQARHELAVTRTSKVTKTFGETISHLRSSSNQVCRAEPPCSSAHSSMAGLSLPSFACCVLLHLLCRFAVRRC